MNFTDVFETGLETYFEQAFASESDLLVYLHIPKAAGNSSLRYIKRFKGNYYDIIWNKIDETWEDFMQKHQKDPFELVSGHFLENHVQLLSEQQISYSSISFLRHPIERIISQYKYMCTPVHPASKEFLKEYPTFESFAFENINPNYMAECLVGQVGSFGEYLEKAKVNYTFLGLTEFYHASMIILCTALDIPYQVTAPRNVTLKTKKNDFQISHQTYQELCEIHSLDLQFYEFLHRNYAKISESLLAYLVESKFEKK